MRKKKNKAVQYFVIKTSKGDGNINLCDLSRSSKQPKRKETHKASPRSGNGKCLSCVARSKTDARKPRKRRKGGQKTSIVVRSSVTKANRHKGEKIGRCHIGEFLSTGAVTMANFLKAMFLTG